MVYSSSAMHAYIARDDTLAIVGPQIFWARARAPGDGRRHAHRLPLAAARVGRRATSSRSSCSSSCCCRVAQSASSAARPAGCCRPAAGDPPGRDRQARAGRVPGPLDRRARARAISGFRSGTVPFLLIAVPVIALVFKEPDLGTTVRHRADRVHDVLRRRREPVAARRAGLVGVAGRARSWACATTRSSASGRSSIRGPTRSGTGFHTDPGPARARARRGLRHRPRREQARRRRCTCRNAWNDFIFAIIGEEFGFIGAGLVIGLFLLLAYAGIRMALGRPTRSARCWPPASPPGCASRRSSTSPSWWRCCR